MMGSLNRGASHSAAAISARFRKTGVKAGTAKRPTLLRIPAAIAVREMNSR